MGSNLVLQAFNKFKQENDTSITNDRSERNESSDNSNSSNSRDGCDRKTFFLPQKKNFFFARKYFLLQVFSSHQHTFFYNFLS